MRSQLVGFIILFCLLQFACKRDKQQQSVIDFQPPKVVEARSYVDGFECSPSGTYREVGREYFVGTYNGQSGTFWTNYKFEAKFEGCAANGSYVGAEIKGRCQHPIAKGSGTGVFEGVTGRLDMKDDIANGNYPFTGHLQF